MKRMTAMLLALAMALALTLSACGGRSGGQEAATPAPDGGAETSETVVTADDRLTAKKLADEFYAPLLTADPVSMVSLFDKQQVSEFKRNGDTMYMTDGTPDYEYYLFVEDGAKYLLSGGEDSAYENEYLYDMFAETIETTLEMFVTGLYDAEDADTFRFSATRTDSDGASTLVSVIYGEEDGQDAAVTVTGTAKNGVVTNIFYEYVVGEEKETAEFRFSCDNVSIKVPACTLVEDNGYGGYDAVLEGEHVESPYPTLQGLIDTLGEDDFLFYIIEDGFVYAIGEKDGRQLQLAAAITEEQESEIDGLDFFSDTYYEDVYAILGALAVTDCVDYTDCLIPQDELDGYAGQPVQTMIDAGFELNGWSINEGVAILTLAKDGLEYDADAIPTEGFDENSDFDSEELYGFTLERVAFAAPQYSALPIR